MREEEAPDFIARGLDPRSVYPRCDFCSARNIKKKDNGDLPTDGTAQVGRWWAHESCAADAENLQLASAQLPKLSYARFMKRGNPVKIVTAMHAYLGAKRQQALRAFRQVMKHRGNALLNPDAPTEFV